MSDQLTSLEGMTPKEIAAATRAGKLDALLKGDADAIELASARADYLATKAEAEPPPPVNPDMGARGGPKAHKYDEAWLATATAAQIARATRAGKLGKLL